MNLRVKQDSMVSCFKRIVLLKPSASGDVAE